MTSRICISCRIISAMTGKPFCFGCESVRAARAEHITALIQRFENDYGSFNRTDEVWFVDSSETVLTGHGDPTDNPFYSSQVSSVAGKESEALTDLEIDVMFDEAEETERKKPVPWKRYETLPSVYKR